ncbi:MULTISPECIES: LTA synthase family protein [unclassified Peribacillus]|uniref:LTA synthase family protein n=1 Tax=unclassified Peribacillus TaxID=2675266 RepID=UPI0019142E49|nr:MULTISPECIES: LTA synthase family protein [unclassified Peribacillus]MBK5443869.1 LTA synthase family protein [Peribacillus sp. TH24]MBK5461412.1 LTA synthase family protein [Peribacillus sp. TH27]MBK5485268.1 LTA synthase family protein [Peribacillus sp. TH16]MBK5499551.1 LTA synthase family protein [Peribacillus sp. TH14]WMX55361.1 LTA synthase family protein [Peribacillus sp. R9-11]
MNNFLKKSQHLFANNVLGFFFIAVVMFQIKTYIGYRVEFNLGIENGLQQFLLFINPISSAILFFGLALLAKGKKSFKWIIRLNLLMSLWLFFNIVYYRSFTDFITLPTLTQVQNAGDLGPSILELFKGHDVFYFLDTVLLIVLYKFKDFKVEDIKIKRRTVGMVYLAGLAIFAINLGLAEKDRPQLLSRTFDRNYIVKYLGMYNYTVYDAVQNTKTYAQRATANSTDIAEVVNYTKATSAEPNPKYFGAAEGKNVIYLHLESMQNFLIDYKLNGEEVTPFLNSLAHDKSDFMYFDNFFHQVGQGKTADAEFMLENSLFGLPQGAAFTNRSQNTYQAAPAILGQKGYTSAVFHGNYKSFWNRDNMYKSLGFNQFFDANHYNMENKEEVLSYGLMDKPFFKESIPMLETLKQPFYTKFITVSHHFPYAMDQEKATIGKQTTGDASVDSYFQTARYADEALKEFFDYLKESGLYDNSVIVMYGDHYGISENHKEAMSKVLDKEVGTFENAQLQRVPLLIHVPGVEGGEMHQYGGQIDLLPTLLHLLGIKSNDYVQFGSDLLSKDHNEVVPFRNGDFVTPDVTSIKGKYYDTNTGELVEENEDILNYKTRAEKMLNLSDQVVNGDLLRFYTPNGFKPIDPKDYDYTYNEEDSKEVDSKAESDK